MPVGRIVLDEEVTQVVDDTKEIFGIKVQSMSQSVKKICEIAVELRDDFNASVEKLFNIIHDHCPELIDSIAVLQVLNIHKKYQKKELK